MMMMSKKNIEIFYYKQRLLIMDMKSKVVQVFKFSKFGIPGSQLLSDVQTFLAGKQLYEL